MTVIYGSSVADATLTTACDMSSITGGVETHVTTTVGSSIGGNFTELWSQTGTTGGSVAAITAPDGHGWVYKPGAGTFGAGNWSASVALDTTNSSGNSDTLTIRFYKYSGGIYTSIGSIDQTFIASGTRAVVNFSATAMPSTTFTSTDLLYVDLWMQDPTGPNTEIWDIYVSTSATAGVTNDMQVTTSIFTPAVAGPKPRYITRGLLSTIIPDVVTQPLPYIDRGMLATIVYENRTFIPRALGGVYIPDTVLWVPRAFGSTTSQALGTTTTYAFTDALSASDSLLVTKIALPVDSLTASDTTLSTDGTIPLDSLTASDIGNLQGWGVDGLTASDSLLVTDSALPVESLTASDTLLTTDGSLYTEANSASDSINGTDSGLLIESLATSDSLLEQETYIPLDALTASDSLLKADTYIPIDAYSASDIGNQQSWGIDALVASDSLLDGGAFVPLDALTGISTPLDWDLYNPLDDNLVADDSASTMVSGSAGATTTTYSFVEALVASDSLLVTDSCIPLDALTASDTGNMTRGFIDALTATDSLLSAAVAIPIDALVASDSLLSEDQLSPYSVAATASDTFIRANQSGWGTASDSEVWSVVLGGAGNFSIASNEGQITGATPIQGAYLGTTTATDMEVLVRYTASATTDNVLIFLRGTASNTQYRIKQAGASFSINRVVTGTNTALQSATFTTTVGQAYWIRAVVEGGPASATLAAKTWQDGNAEPLKWNLSGVVDGSPITGAGQFGLGCGLTVTTDTVKYDTYTVALYASPDALIASDFGGMTRGFVEALAASDTLSVSDAYVPTEVQSVAESLLAGDSASWIDLLSASDSFSAVITSPQPPKFLTATWVTRDGLVAWVTRDGKVTWATRDEKAAWDTRDDQASWDTRDDLATWKTRGG